MWGAPLGLAGLYPQIFHEGETMFANPFFGADFGAAQQSNVGGLVGGQAGPGHSHSIYDPGHHHGIDPHAALREGMYGVAEMARRQEEMRKLMNMHADGRRGLGQSATVGDLARWLEENPGADSPRYQPISQPAPNKVLLLLE